MLNFKEKNLYKFISILACCLFIFIKPVYAEDIPTVIFGGTADPDTYIYPRYVVPSWTFNTADACDKVALLTSDQLSVLDNFYDDNINLAYVDSNDNFYIGIGLWTANLEPPQFLGNSGLSNNGVYLVSTDGTLSSRVEQNTTLDISTLLLWEHRFGGQQLLANFNVFEEGCAVFQSFDVTLNSSPTNTGTTTGEGNYTYGTNVTITATPNTDYRFVSWSDGNTSNPRVINVKSNVSLTAIFESTVSSPNLNLPNVTLPQQTINTEQNTYLNTHSSNAVKGGSINLFQIDYYNVYTVLQTAESDEFFDSRNDNYYVYQNSSDGIGHYIFAVYDKSKLYVFAPNMSVSSSGFTLTYSQAHNMSYSYASSNGLIQRDVNKFEFEYIDKTLNDYYGYDKLPFSNSTNNQNHLEWIGTKTKMLNGQASSMSAALTLNTGTIMTNLNFVITDTTNSYENAQMMNNQTVINNNMNQNFTELNNTIFDGDTETQQVVSNNDNSNEELNSTIDQYNQLEQSFKDDLDDNLNAIDFTFDFGGIADFSTSANFVRTQFDNLTNNPFGSLIGFSLAVGLALLIMGRRL